MNVLRTTASLFAIIFATSVFAQSKSTGGSLGKANKSVSGTVKKKTSNKQTRKPVRTPNAIVNKTACSNIPGIWRWFFGGNVIFKTNGTFRQPGMAKSGHWTCSGRNVVMVWSDGITDTLNLSGNAKQMKGRNNFGLTISGSRL